MATILIVDDLAANRKVLAILLGSRGHKMIEAEDGAEALRAVRADPPDLVITDVLMPTMDGYELVRQLRLEPATSGIPVVFYTAHYGEREARELALSSGVAYVLTKPAESEQVLSIVGQALSGGSETGLTAHAAPLVPAFDREHLRLVTDKLSEKAGDLKIANARLRALINIGLEFSSERQSDRLLHRVCLAARDLFSATYVTLGILDHQDRTVQRFLSCGTDGTCVDTATYLKQGDTISGILRTVVVERRTLRGLNPDGDPLKLDLPTHHPEVQAFLAAPIVSPAHVYGWICLVSNEGREFTEDDEQLIMAMSGQVGRIYELEHEIVEREQAENALRQERDRAQRYLDTAQVILLALDPAGRITLINRAACDLLGRTESELLGCDWIDTCLPYRFRGQLRKNFDQLVDGDLSVIENPILTQSGEERLIEWRNTVLRDNSGQIIGTFSSGTDITDRTQAVAALRIADERMRFVLQTAEVGIWDMDFSTGALRWSEILEVHHGLQPGTFTGTFEAFIERIYPEDRAAVLTTIASATKSGADFSVQYRAPWPDGKVRWLSGAGRILLASDGTADRAVGITLDVTARHTLEEQFQQAQKMEAIGRLAGGVAHDFNNLLTAILGYCELLLSDLDPNDPRHADISEIQKAGVSAAGLTRQLLAFSRKQIIEPIELDLNAVVTHMRPMLARLIGVQVKIVLNLTPDLAILKADRGQMEQVLLNLAINARDAMPHGGTLTIETDNVELDENYAQTHFSVTSGPYVALTVTDTGAGMTPEVQSRLFEPFFTTKEVGKGTGLGLATVHGIVTRGGGSVNVYSELDRGTSFKVYLPRVEGGVAVVPKVMPLTDTVTQTVLVVEDVESIRELAMRLLERQGYTVLGAANANEALQAFESNAPIDVLLTDIVMPGATGLELSKRLLELRPALKVIYMSGYAQQAIVQHGMVKPGLTFLNKPFTSETLGRKVRQVLDQEVITSSL